MWRESIDLSCANTLVMEFEVQGLRAHVLLSAEVLDARSLTCAVCKVYVSKILCLLDSSNPVSLREAGFVHGGVGPKLSDRGR